MNNQTFEVQEERELYFTTYDSSARFVSYYYQIDLVKRTNPRSILEVGIGNGTVSNYLKAHGFNVTTCDFDRELQPDHVADVRDLPFQDRQFDTVMACEIIEHIPWNTVDKALDELARVSRRFVVISIPYSRIPFEMVIKFPFVDTLAKAPYLRFFAGIPHFYKENSGMDSHHWEMGRKGTSIDTVRNKLEKRFRIVKESSPELNPKHYFFVLRKR